MSNDPKISPYSLNDLKNTTDDALANYLRGLSFKQDNSKLDFRLAVGYTSVVIAGATFAADYKLGWEATKHWTAVAVAAYAVLNALFTYWMWAVESGLVFEGVSTQGNRVSIASKTKKHDPTYYLTVTTTSPASSAEFQERQILAPFTTWFTADGYFVAQPFQKWLASSVREIGDVDTKNAGRDESHLAADANGTPASVSGSEPKTPGTGSKRTKRKG